MNNSQHKTPWLPEGGEVVIGMIVAGLFWWRMYTTGYPMWAYVPVIVLVYAACVYGLNMWTEGNRMYAKSMTILRQISPALDEAESYIGQIRNQQARENLNEGLSLTRQIIEELLKQKPGVLYSGITEIATWIKRLGETVPEYVDVQNYPRKAGAKFSQLMQEDEEGFAGYRDWASEMLERVNRGDVFSMTTNARLLRSLRNLLGDQTKK